ncbi:receptor-type tyrosine-protein phosphatase H [Anolis sagrei]|uniref:receptor-type tyrosine-protein phosphatase H n=1 Tax=Anolis sagrei TaxID=38937 RepID=UPI0035202FCE
MMFMDDKNLLSMEDEAPHHGQSQAQPPDARNDCCKDSIEVTENITVELCSPSVDVNATKLQCQWDTEAQEMGCINTTDLCHENQSQVCVNTAFPLLPNCTVSICTGPSPVKNLTLGIQTNSSIILHWQIAVDCCSTSPAINHTSVADDNWRNGTTEISRLLPGEDYTITVYRTLDGRVSQGTSINVTTIPSPVVNVAIKNRTTDSLTIGWTPPGDCQANTYNYTVCILNCTVVSESPYIAEHLQAGVTYSIVIYAVTKSNISSPGKHINATTVPTSPNVSVIEYGNNSFSFSWNPPENQKASYTYCLSWLPEDEKEPLQNCCISDFSYTIQKLLPGRLYSVNVTSEIHGLKSEKTTKWILTVPSPPTDFSIQTINQTAAMFTWVAPCSPFSGYQLKWKNDSEENGICLLQTSKGTVLPGLTPSTNYTFTLFSLVKGRNMTRLSTDVQLQKATKPEKVTDLQCRALSGGDKLKLSWKCPQNKISELRILVWNQIWTTWDTCTKSVVIDRLQPARRYRIQVRTYWYDQYAMSDLDYCFTDNTGIIVGPLVAVLLLLVILSLLLLYFRRRKPSNGLKKPKPDMGLPEVHVSVPVSTFPNYCDEKFSSSAFGFVKEYQQLQDIVVEQPQSVVQQPENQPKNRYCNVVPYDHARVQLLPRPGDPNSDYINASYMPGFKREKEFIAAQGPLRETLCDFWRMIWEQRITTLVMLTNCFENGRAKCERYWPLDYTPCTYEDISVSVLTETILPDWTVRDFSIKRVNESEVRLARHYHYSSWPDHGVPETTSGVLHFRDLVRAHIEEHKDSGPALVHCSAGVGRTGTFIALDSLLRQAQEEGQLGVFSFVQRLRMNRPLMIQTESQYIFLHQCLLDGIKSATKPGMEKTEYTIVYENASTLREYEISRV